MKKLTISGTVNEQGILEIDRKAFSNGLIQFAGQKVTLTVAKFVKHRSNPQNAFLWSVVYPNVLHGLIEAGYDIETNDIELVHSWCKKEFLEARKIGKKDIETSNGEFITLPASTTRLSTIEFNQYIERISQFAAEFLGVVIPEPFNEANWPTENQFQ